MDANNLLINEITNLREKVKSLDTELKLAKNK